MKIENLLRYKKQRKFTAYLLRHLETGKNKVESKALEHQLTDESTVQKILNALSVSLMIKTKNEMSFTVEFPRVNREMISPDKSQSYNQCTLIILLSRMLVLELISLGKGFKPFWNSQCVNNSAKLWLPTKTDSVDSGSNSSTTSSNSMEVKLPSSTIQTNQNPTTKNLQKISFQSSMSSIVDKWEKGDTVIKNRKIKLYPTAEQKTILRQWFGTSRFVYNRTLADFKNKDGYYKINPNEHPLAYEVNLSYLFSPGDSYNFYYLRDYYVTKKGNPHLNEWEFDTPKEIRANCLRKLTSNFKSAFTNLRNGNITKFSLNFKSRKDKSETIEIPKNAIKKTNDGVVFFQKFMKDTIKVKSRTKKNFHKLEINHTCTLMHNQFGYYLLVPVKELVKEKKDGDKKIALDPGVRTFQTGFSQTEILECSSRMETIEKLYQKIDKLRSLKKGNLAKIGKKISNIIDDIHWKTITFLHKNYNDVLLPNFESKKISMKHILGKSTHRKMYSLKHYTFRQRLIEKSKSIKNFRVYVVSEEYTSQTCGRCGNLHTTLQGKKIYNCKECGLTIDRDVNGARNILLKHLK